MFISTTSSDYSIMDCPPIRPLLMDTTTKWKSNKIEVAPNCPRCASSNTKFCYYNNYSLSQPRYFCKACRRYWTKGGSLRNVPVGGGCRKTRRARAARQGGGGTVSHTGTTFSPTRAEQTNESIDLAAVFAKYLNPNVENIQDHESCSPGVSCASSENVQAGSLDLDHQIEDFAAFDQNHEPLDLINGTDDQSQLMIPQVSTHEINCQDFVYDQNCEMQGILDDHELVAGDILWSDVTNLPDFESRQSTVQIQDFGLFLPDDQLRISANLVHDNWGSFDLSGYEIFSRP